MMNMMILCQPSMRSRSLLDFLASTLSFGQGSAADWS